MLRLSDCKGLYEDLINSGDIKNYFDVYMTRSIDTEMYQYIEYLFKDIQTELSNSNFTTLLKKYKSKNYNVKYKMNLKEKYKGDILTHPKVNTLTNKTSCAIFVNTIKIFFLENYDKYQVIDNDVDENIIERPLSLDGIFNPKERTSYYNKDKTIVLDDKKVGYLNDKDVERERENINSILVPNQYIDIDALTEIKNNKNLIKVKTADSRDMDLMDFLIRDLKKILYSPDKTLKYSIKAISKALYGEHAKRFYGKTKERLIKLSIQKYVKIPKGVEIKNIQDFIDNTEGIVGMFDIEFDKHDKDICYVMISTAIIRDLMNNRTLKLNVGMLDSIEDDFTKVFINFLQKERIYCCMQNIYSKTFSYDVFKLQISFTNPRRKKSNLEMIENSLQFLKNKHFIVSDYMRIGEIVTVNWIHLENNEIELIREDEEPIKMLAEPVTFA